MPYPTSCYHTEYRCHTVSYISSMYRFSHPPRRHAQAIPGGKEFHLGRWHTRRRVAHNKETSTSIMAWYVFPPFFLSLFLECPFPRWHLRSSHKLRHPLAATTHAQIHIHTHTSTRTGSKNTFSRQLRDRGFWHLQATTCSTTGILTPGAVRCLLSMISPSRFTNNCRALTVRGPADCSHGHQPRGTQTRRVDSSKYTCFVKTVTWGKLFLQLQQRHSCAERFFSRPLINCTCDELHSLIHSQKRKFKT